MKNAYLCRRKETLYQKDKDGKENRNVWRAHASLLERR